MLERAPSSVNSQAGRHVTTTLVEENTSRRSPSPKRAKRDRSREQSQLLGGNTTFVHKDRSKVARKSVQSQKFVSLPTKTGTKRHSFKVEELNRHKIVEAENFTTHSVRWPEPLVSPRSLSTHSKEVSSPTMVKGAKPISTTCLNVSTNASSTTNVEAVYRMDPCTRHSREANNLHNFAPTFPLNDASSAKDTNTTSSKPCHNQDLDFDMPPIDEAYAAQAQPSTGKASQVTVANTIVKPDNAQQFVRALTISSDEEDGDQPNNAQPSLLAWRSVLTFG